MAYKDDTIPLPSKLRGRSIRVNVIPTVCNLKNMLRKLDSVQGNVSRLKSWEKRSYQAYQIDKIKSFLLNEPKDQKVRLIKEHILQLPPTELGASCIDMYLVAYVAENYAPGKQAFIDYILKEGISEKENTAQAIWQVGKGDGVYLEILNVDGSILDREFFAKWINGTEQTNRKTQKVFHIHNKLVRDRIPKLIEESGKMATSRTLDDQEFKIELKNKAFEELEDYVESKTKEEALEELSDLLEVVYALAETHGITHNKLEETRKQKTNAQGGFKDKVFLMEVEV